MKISVTQAAANIAHYYDMTGKPFPGPNIVFGRMPPYNKTSSDGCEKKKDCEKTTTK